MTAVQSVTCHSNGRHGQCIRVHAQATVRQVIPDQGVCQITSSAQRRAQRLEELRHRRSAAIDEGLACAAHAAMSFVQFIPQLATV